jgi:transcriptional regulator with XRE-family HTH domain
MEFIDKLHELLEDNRISKNRLAKEIGISEGTIRSWENGKYPTIEKLIKISQYFSISTDELLCINEDYSELEKQLISGYNKASERDKNIINQILGIKEQNHIGRKSSDSKIG